MKLAVIATALLASSTAFASSVLTDTGSVFFTAQQEPVCAMRVMDEHAPVFFNDQGSLDHNNYAKVELRADYATKTVIHVNGDWTDVSAWDGKTPETVIHTVIEGDAGNYGDSQLSLPFQEEHKLTGKKDQRVVYQMGVQAEPMSHAGSARLDATVQFECE